MTIAFVWPFDKAPSIVENWRDGLRAALEELAKTHEVTWFIGGEEPPPGFDAYLLWDDSTSRMLPLLHALRGRVGLCLTTSPFDYENLKHADVIFCESDAVYTQVRAHGLRAKKAFGTDEQFFAPSATVPKTITHFYPATFSPWKRQSAISHLGNQLVCIGTRQPDGDFEYQACIDSGVNVSVGYFPAERIRDTYRKAHNVLIPAVHGSERTILEAMSMDLFPRVNPENKAYALIREYQDSGIHTPRKFILDRYTAKHYAQALEKGLSG